MFKKSNKNAWAKWALLSLVVASGFMACSPKNKASERATLAVDKENSTLSPAAGSNATVNFIITLDGITADDKVTGDNLTLMRSFIPHVEITSADVEGMTVDISNPSINATGDVTFTSASATVSLPTDAVAGSLEKEITFTLAIADTAPEATKTAFKGVTATTKTTVKLTKS